MTDIVIKGIGLGLLLSVLAGPMFFSLIQLGMERGLKAGVFLAAGQWLSDIMILVLAYLGLNLLHSIPNLSFYLSTFGGIALILFGIAIFFTKPPIDDENKHITAKYLSGYFAKGFIINTLNPFPFVFWVSLTGDSANQGYSFFGFVLLYASLMLTIAGTDIAKIALAQKIKPYIKPNYLKIARVIVGLALMIFGAFLMYKGGK